MPINLSTLLLATVTHNRQDIRLTLAPNFSPLKKENFSEVGSPTSPFYHKFWLIKHLPQRTYIFKMQRTATSDQKRATNHCGWDSACSLPPNLEYSLGPSPSPEGNDTPLYPWILSPWLDQGQMEPEDSGGSVFLYRGCWRSNLTGRNGYLNLHLPDTSHKMRKPQTKE